MRSKKFQQVKDVLDWQLEELVDTDGCMWVLGWSTTGQRGEETSRLKTIAQIVEAMNNWTLEFEDKEFAPLSAKVARNLTMRAVRRLCRGDFNAIFLLRRELAEANKKSRVTVGPAKEAK